MQQRGVASIMMGSKQHPQRPEIVDVSPSSLPTIGWPTASSVENVNRQTGAVQW